MSTEKRREEKRFANLITTAARNMTFGGMLATISSVKKAEGALPIAPLSPNGMSNLADYWKRRYHWSI
jgi:hypothetical protein